MEDYNQKSSFNIKYNETTGDTAVYNKGIEVMHLLLEPNLSEAQVNELIFAELPKITELNIFDIFKSGQGEYLN